MINTANDRCTQPYISMHEPVGSDHCHVSGFKVLDHLPPAMPEASEMIIERLSCDQQALYAAQRHYTS